jgi:hypothetical protein
LERIWSSKVNHDEIQKLMSGYATGSLSDSERRMLYEAALEDQDLFEQLSGEHALKQLIETPGVRDRLIASLEPAHASGSTARGWLKPLSWGLAMAFVAGVSLTAVFIARSSLQKANEPAQVAQAIAPAAQPAPASIASAPTVEPRGVNGPVSAQPPRVRLADRKQAGKPDQQQADKDADAKKKTVRKDTPAGDAALAKAEERDGRAVGALKASPAPVAASTPPPPPPATNSVSAPQIAGQISTPVQAQPQQFVSVEAQAAQVPQVAQAQSGPSQGRQKQAPPGTGGGGGFGGRALSINGRTEESKLAKEATARFAFDYALEGLDMVFKFYADGYFSLHIAPGGLTIVDSPVTAGTIRRERIQNNGTEADIVFSATPQLSTGGVKLSSDTRSGTAVDPGRRRIELLVRFYPPPF